MMSCRQVSPPLSPEVTYWRRPSREPALESKEVPHGYTIRSGREPCRRADAAPARGGPGHACPDRGAFGVVTSISDRPLGPRPPAPDCWLWLHGAWFRQAGPGPGCVPGNSAGTWRARAPSDGMAHDRG